MYKRQVYSIKNEIKADFKKEVSSWIELGWLKEYSGEEKGLLPHMAVVQANKGKVRPVLDYRELNDHVSSHTSESVICAKSIRRWRQMGSNLKIVDLRKAYVQIRIDKNLWPFQIVRFEEKTYCLNRLGFGLNVAHKVMTAIVNKVLAADDQIRSATDSYIDDIVVNEDKVAADQVLSLIHI